MPRNVKGGWEIGGFAFDENPRFTTPRWATSLVELWLRLRLARGMSERGPGPQVFPRSGGYCDQPALAIEAFELFDHWQAELKRDAS